jgi:hypothetical protein
LWSNVFSVPKRWFKKVADSKYLNDSPVRVLIRIFPEPPPLSLSDTHFADAEAVCDFHSETDADLALTIPFKHVLERKKASI